MSAPALVPEHRERESRRVPGLVAQAAVVSVSGLSVCVLAVGSQSTGLARSLLAQQARDQFGHAFAGGLRDALAEGV